MRNGGPEYTYVCVGMSVCTCRDVRFHFFETKRHQKQAILMKNACFYSENGVQACKSVHFLK